MYTIPRPHFRLPFYYLPGKTYFSLTKASLGSMASHCYQDTSSSSLGTKITTYYRPMTRRKLLAASKHKRKLHFRDKLPSHRNLRRLTVLQSSFQFCQLSWFLVTLRHKTWHCTDGSCAFDSRTPGFRSVT